MVATRTSKIWLEDDGIIQVKINPGAVIVLADVEGTIEEICALSGGRQRPMRVDLNGANSIGRPVRKKLATLSCDSAGALVARSWVPRVMAYFFIGLNHLETPTRLFADEQEALDRLREFQE